MADNKDLKKFRGGIRLDASTDTEPANAEVGAMYVDTNGTLKIYNGSAWDSVGSGAGTTNYVSTAASKGDSVSGFATYADAGAVTPVDGTAGSATAGMLTQDTSTKLRGINCIKLLKAASTAEQGMGISYDFTIDKADKGKKLIISFDYTEGSSGDYEDGNARVFIYDKDNTNLIRVNGEDIKANTGMGKHYAQFQTASDSDDYRLIIHIADAGNGATHDWELFLDNISVAPQTISHGAATTDWQSFTPTGSWTANTTYSGQVRRVGDSAEFEFHVAVSGGAPTSASLTIELPSGYVGDTAKLASINVRNVIGQAKIYDNNTGTAYLGCASFNDNNTINVDCIPANATYSTYTSVTQAVPITFGDLDSISVDISIPIVGWSANAKMSEDFSGRDVVFIAEESGATALPNGAQTVINWGTVHTDTTSGFGAGTTGYYTIPETGYYDIAASISIGASTDFDEGEKIYIRLLGIGTSSAEIAQGGVLELQASPSGSSYYGSSLFKTHYCTKGEQYAIAVYQSSGTESALEATGQSNFVSIVKRNSAQTILENETTVCSSNGMSGTFSVDNSTDTIITTWDNYTDTHGAFNGTYYTVPSTGYYDINCNLQIQADGDTDITSVSTRVYKDIGSGNVVMLQKSVQTGAEASQSCTISQTASLNKGDKISFWLRQTNADSDTMTFSGTGDEESFFSIHKIK